MDNGRRFSRNRPSRGIGLRRTTGCLTCRRRRVRCDEAQPQCGGCARNKFTCEYSQNQPPRSRTSRREHADTTKSEDKTKTDIRCNSATNSSEIEETAKEKAKKQCESISDSIDYNYEGRGSSPTDHFGDWGKDRNNSIGDGPGHDNNLPNDSACVITEINGNGCFSGGRGTGTSLAVGTDLSDEGNGDNSALSQKTSQTEGSRLVASHDVSQRPSEQDSALIDYLATARAPSTNHSISIEGQFPRPVDGHLSSIGLEDENYSHIYNLVYEKMSPNQVPSYPTPLSSNTKLNWHQDGGESSPTSRWLNLLISDAALEPQESQDLGLGSNGLDIFGNPITQVSRLPQEDSSSASQRDDSRQSVGLCTQDTTRSQRRLHPYVQERFITTSDEQKDQERLSWKTHEAIELQPQEHVLFQHFIEQISQWMDLFDALKPFSTFLPHLALYNTGLMNAILALSARHLSIVNRDFPRYVGGFCPTSNDPVKYYYKSLHYSQEAMQYDTFKTSLELLSSALIISSYEMLDGSSTDWEKHLKGVFWIQRSQVIHGDSSGLRQAVWWAWICQDTWAAFRERRKPFTFWSSTRRLADLNPFELAARSVYNFAQVVGFCALQDPGCQSHLDSRSTEAEFLMAQMEDWKSYLTVEFNPLPLNSLSTNAEVFPRLWIRPVAFAVSMQVYYCSLILLRLHQPFTGGMQEYFKRQQKLRKWAGTVCGIAKTSVDDGSSVMTTQCVYIAGMILQDEKQRSAALDLLASCSKRAGWPGYSLGDDLQQIWQEG